MNRANFIRLMAGLPLVGGVVVKLVGDGVTLESIEHPDWSGELRAEELGWVDRWPHVEYSAGFVVSGGRQCGKSFILAMNEELERVKGLRHAQLYDSNRFLPVQQLEKNRG